MNETPAPARGQSNSTASGPTIGQLKYQRNKLSDQIRDMEQAEARANAERFVGRFFKQRNAYGINADPWWIYRKFIAYEDHRMVAFAFSEDTTGLIKIDSQERHALDIVERCEEITKEEFEEQWNKLRGRIGGLWRRLRRSWRI